MHPRALAAMILLCGHVAVADTGGPPDAPPVFEPEQESLLEWLTSFLPSSGSSMAASSSADLYIGEPIDDPLPLYKATVSLSVLQWAGPTVHTPVVTLDDGHTVRDFKRIYSAHPTGHALWSGAADDGSVLTLAVNASEDIWGFARLPDETYHLVVHDGLITWRTTGDDFTCKRSDTGDPALDEDTAGPMGGPDTSDTAYSGPSALTSGGGSSSTLSPLAVGPPLAMSSSTPTADEDDIVDLALLYSTGGASELFDFHTSFATPATECSGTPAETAMCADFVEAATMNAFVTLAYTNHALDNVGRQSER